MKTRSLLVLLLPILFIGCTTLSDTIFLVQKLDDLAKSNALTAKGIEQFDIHIVRKAEYDMIPQIKEYFTVALRYDSTNESAQQYLELVQDYRANKLQANLNDAARILAKPKRTDDDTYVLAVALQTAVRVDPSNAEVARLMNETAQVRAALVDGYLAKAKAAVDKLDSKSTDAVREKQYLEAYQWADKAAAADPVNAVAAAQKKAAFEEISTMVVRRVDAARKAIAAGSFTDAKAQVTALNDLNRKVNGSFETDVKAVSYALNYTWAARLFDQKDYATAGVKVDAALAVERTGEATALKKKITDQKGKADASISFDTSLKDIDRLIASGELVAAHRKIDALAKTTKDQASLQMLDDRNGKIHSQLKDLYERGVQAYKDEDFKSAMDLLGTIVGIQVDYEQASDYLDKARSKQKLLDQY